jgi:hypothetical protein
MDQRIRFGIWTVNAGLITLLAMLSAPLLVAQQISAQTQASPSASAFKTELVPLSFFIGQWNCEGEFVASKKPIASHIGVSVDLGGSWLVFRWDDNAPNHFQALELWGFDKTSKYFINFIFSNSGGARLFRSLGWDGDTLLWTSDALLTVTTVSERFLIERKPPREFVISWQVRKAEANWTTGDRLTCRQ